MLGPVLRQDVLGSTSTSKDAGLCLPTCQLCHRVLHPSYSSSSPSRGMGDRDAGSPGSLTILRLLQDVQDVCQFQRQLIRLLGHVRVYTLDLRTVCRTGEWNGLSPPQVPPCPASRQARTTGGGPGDNAVSSGWLSPILNRTLGQHISEEGPLWEGRAHILGRPH